MQILSSFTIWPKLVRGAIAGAGAALLGILFDAATRTRWGAGFAEQTSVILPLLVFLGCASGVALASVTTAWRTLARVFRDHRKRELVTMGGIAGAVAVSAAFVALDVNPTGRLRGSLLVKLVPWVVALVAGAVSFAWMRVERSGSPRTRTALVAGSVVVGAGVFFLDGALLVGTHRPIHALAEGAAALLWIGALTSSIRHACRRRPELAGTMRHVGAALVALCPFWAIVQLAGGAPFANARHLLHEPTALGAIVTGIAKLGTPPPPPAAVEDRWTVGEQEPLAEKAAVQNLRSVCPDCNIIVYLVDTLRADVASDPALMPRLTGLAAESLSFVEAYSTASDTLQALPTLLAGRYDPHDARTFLEHAKTANLETALFIPGSARDYLEAHLPEFKFDHTSVVADHSEDKAVWGYGADIPTGDAIAERAVEWIGEHRSRRFLAWVYNFDLHGWRDLRDDLLSPPPTSDASPEARYRHVAQTVDRSLGRVLEALRTFELEERTIVLFVSDHGEALGYRGFAAHSAFLWQPLVRVPLVVRIPGLEPRAVARQVSLVDVAPTLARFVEPSREAGPYHGLDLLRLYTNPETERSLPILLRASSEGRPSMLGLVHPTRKLVVPVAGGPPQLHDLTVDDPDETDLTDLESEHASKLLGDLASSPLSPR